jgi:hypothetical protein
MPQEHYRNTTGYNFDETLTHEMEGYDGHQIGTDSFVDDQEDDEDDTEDQEDSTQTVQDSQGFPWLFHMDQEDVSQHVASNQQDDLELDALINELSLNVRSQDPTIYCPIEKLPLSKIFRTELYPGAAEVYSKEGLTFMDRFTRNDPFAQLRQQNPYIPFTSFDEWEFTNILFRMPCSLSWKSELLSTRVVSKLEAKYSI